MQKIINEKENIVEESMEGFVGAFSRYWLLHPSVKGVLSRYPRKDKVALVIGGGSGHEPIFSGFVGKGLADAAACGNIFASPDPNTVYQTAKAVDQGKGILFVYGCYAGDNLNFDMGEEFLNADGIPTAHVRVQDDVTSQPIEKKEDRRGIAGDVFVVKIAGAACDAGLSLDEAFRVVSKARDNTRSVGVATAPAQLPGADKPIFELPEGEIEYGMGLHGEKGVKRINWEPADTMAETMLKQILDDGDFSSGDEVCVLLNAFGSTSITELAIVFRKVKLLLEEKGIKIYDSDLNNYCRCQEMGGFSISLLKLDEELKRYYDMPCFCPFYARGAFSAVTEGEELVVQAEKEFDETDVEETPVVRSKEGTLDVLNAEDARNMLIYVADRIIANVDYLTEVDSQTGDGDHGIGMAGGMQKAKKKLIRMEATDNVYAPFALAGKEMLLSMGGASGVIFGSLFLAGSQNKEEKAILTAEDFAAMEKQSLSSIQERGKAQVGDKTMVDALSPAVDAMEKVSEKGLLTTLKAAEEAAEKGVLYTKECIAKFGKAKSLGERSLGYQDAGATSVYLIFQAMREFVEG